MSEDKTNALTDSDNVSTEAEAEPENGSSDVPSEAEAEPENGSSESESPPAETKKVWKEHDQFAEEVAEKIGEKQKSPRLLIRDIVRTCGIEFVQSLLDETLKIEAEGGMMTLKGDRRRTTGGVFFKLAKDRMSDDQRQDVFPVRSSWRDLRTKVKRKRIRNTMNWEDRLAAVQQIKSKGKVKQVRVRLIGTTGDVRREGETVVVQMEHKGGGASLPVGVPEMPETPTIYTVYIANQQWKKVYKGLKDKWLVVEGLCAYDPEIDGIAVFATGLKIQAPKGEEGGKKAQSTKADKPKKAKSAPESDEKEVGSPDPPAAKEIEMDIPADAPPPVQKKLRELYTAAAQLRQKIADLETRNQTTTLAMTQKLLTNTERQIESVLKKYGG